LKNIEVPGEGVNFGSVNSDGDFVNNESLSDGEVDYYSSEYHGF